MAVPNQDEILLALADNHPCPVSIINKDGITVYRNTGAVKILGAASPTSNKGGFLNIVHPDYRDMAIATFEDILSGGSKNMEEPFVLKVIAPDGSSRWVKSAGSLVEFRGKPSVFVTFFDITDQIEAEEDLRKLNCHLETLVERKTKALKRSVSELKKQVQERIQAEEELIRSEERYRSTVESQTDLIARCLPDRTLTFVNQAYCDFHGKSREELIGLDWIKLSPKEERRKRQNHFEGLTPESPVQVSELEVIGSDGQTYCQQWKETGIFDSDGKLVEVLGVCRDITDRVKAEQELLKSQSQFRALAEQGIIGTMILDGYSVMYVNQKACDLFGLSKEEALSIDNVLEKVHPEDKATAAGALQWASQNPGQPAYASIRCFRKDGSIFNAESHGMRVQIDDKDCIVGFILDVTERETAKQELEQRFRELSILYKIGNAAGSSIDLPEVKRQVSRILEEELKVVAGLFVSPWELSEFGITKDENSWGIHARIFKSYKRAMALACGIPIVVDTGKPMVRDNILETAKNADARMVQYLPKASGVITFPVKARGKVMDVIALFFKDDDSWKEFDLAFLEAVGQQVGIYLRNAAMHQEISSSRERLKALSLQVITAQEEERRNIAKELHDEIGQYLTGLKIRLDISGKREGGLSRENALKATEIVNELIDKVRDLSLNLRPSMLDDMGLAEAIRWFVERYQTFTGIEVELQIDEAIPRCSQDVETAAYRIIQESLNNVARHAKVNKTSVTVVKRADLIAIAVEDKGVGYDPSKLDVTRTAGLAGMHERALLVNGEVVVRAEPNDGVLVMAKLPIIRSDQE